MRLRFGFKRVLAPPLRLASRSLLIGGVLFSGILVHADATLGAGSSAAAPVYQAWATAYGRSTTFQLMYAPIGSSAGLKKILAREVAFGASDVAPAELDLAKDNLVLVPTFVSGAVPVVNLPKMGNLKVRLNGEVLARIFMGHITRWNSPEIQGINAGLALPDLAIKPVVRSDGSGTTFYFTDFLSKVSPAWRDQFGAKSTVAWPAGFIGAKGSDSVADAVKQTVGAIGYIDFNYVAKYELTVTYLRNASGEFLLPSAAAFRAALRASEWASKGNFHASLANLAGSNVWPITMGTFVLFPKQIEASIENESALRFFVWALLKGDQVVENLSFVRLPDKMQALAFKALFSVKDAQGHQLGLDAMASFSRP